MGRGHDEAVRGAGHVVAGGIAVGPRGVAELDEQHQGVAGVRARALSGDHARREVAAERLALRLLAHGRLDRVLGPRRRQRTSRAARHRRRRVARHHAEALQVLGDEDLVGRHGAGRRCHQDREQRPEHHSQQDSSHGRPSLSLNARRRDAASPVARVTKMPGVYSARLPAATAVRPGRRTAEARRAGRARALRPWSTGVERRGARRPEGPPGACRAVACGGDEVFLCGATAPPGISLSRRGCRWEPRTRPRRCCRRCS